jgi:hypothetical protein
MLDPPFSDLPNGQDIAHYFHDAKLTIASQGAEGYNLWRSLLDGNYDYCYLWIVATVDFDVLQYDLLEIRTNIADEETRDYLFVRAYPIVYNWYNNPIKFSATHEQHVEHIHDGLHWFVNQVMLDRE